MSAENNENPYYIRDHDVIYAIRTAHQNQTQLVVLADQKANILIGVVAITFTILFTNTGFLAGIDRWIFFMFCAFLLLEVIAILGAFLVIFPNNIRHRNNHGLEEITNPLFFGLYTEFAENDYVQYMLQQMHDNRSARQILLTDFYQIGAVLRKKYLLLKYAYGFAVIGFVLLLPSVGIFLITG